MGTIRYPGIPHPYRDTVPQGTVQGYIGGVSLATHIPVSLVVYLEASRVWVPGTDHCPWLPCTRDKGQVTRSPSRVTTPSGLRLSLIATVATSGGYTRIGTGSPKRRSSRSSCPIYRVPDSRHTSYPVSVYGTTVCGDRPHVGLLFVNGVVRLPTYLTVACELSRLGYHCGAVHCT